MRVPQHPDLPVDVLELLKPPLLRRLAPPEVRVPTELVAALLQGAQQ